jgi:hypothetical protein
MRPTRYREVVLTSGNCGCAMTTGYDLTAFQTERLAPATSGVTDLIQAVHYPGCALVIGNRPATAKRR